VWTHVDVAVTQVAEHVAGSEETMNLHALLRNRAADGEPIRVGVIGAGKFGTMFLAQTRTTLGIHVVAVADLAASRARRAMSEAGYEEKHSSARSHNSEVAPCAAGCPGLLCRVLFSSGARR
jgi:threonine dehydrogenase-like Zn-dependent dehydrogenase